MYSIKHWLDFHRDNNCLSYCVSRKEEIQKYRVIYSKNKEFLLASLYVNQKFNETSVLGATVWIESEHVIRTTILLLARKANRQ